MSENTAMNQKEAAEFGALVNEVREINSKVEKNAFDMEKMSKMESRLFELEELNQKHVLSLQKSANDAEAFELKIAKLEKALALAGNGKTSAVDSEEIKAFKEFLRLGEPDKALERKSWQTQEAKQLLRTDFGPVAGFLVPEEYSRQLIKTILEVSPMRSICKQMRTSSKELIIPKRKGYTNATWKGEAETGDESNPEYAELRLTPERLDTTVAVTREMLMDSAFDLESEINEVVTRNFAQAEGIAQLNGDGLNKPKGILQSDDVGSLLTANIGQVTMDDIIDLPAQLKIGYSGIYIFNQRTAAYLRKNTTSDGNYLWQPAMANGTPATLNGYSYVIMPDMPDVAAGEYPIMYGDFFRAYTIIDRTDIRLIVDEVTRKKEAIIEYTFQKWTGGDVVLGEAVKKLEVRTV